MGIEQQTILVVDDDISVVQLERVQLERAGYRVCIAGSAEQALARAKQGDVDLAIVDLCLAPGVTGLDLVEQFQLDGLHLPVIIVTGHSEEGTVITALRAGVCDFIPKTRAYLDYLPEAAARVLKQEDTERRLAESEARFVSFMDSGPALCFIKDQQGRFVFVNRQLREMFDVDDWTGKTVFDLLPEELARQVHADDLEVLANGTSSEKSYDAYDPDGSLRKWVTYRFPMTDIHGGRLMGGVAVDVSEPARAESALRISEAKFRAVSEAATDAVIAIDQYANVISWNGAAARMFGYTTEEMLGQSMQRIVPERFRRPQSEALARVREQGASALQGHPLESFGLRQDGTEFPIELSVGSWEDGGELFFTGIIRDVTDRKRAEEELHKRDEQLRHSQRLEALGTLAGGVAHEFNNLLQSIQGYTQYARDSLEVGDPRRQDLDLVLTATSRAASLTRQLLGFSRRQMLQFVDLDPNHVVQEAGQMLRPLIGEHIQLEVVLGEDVGTIYADPTHLQQLLMNLAVNARDAMPGGGQLLIKTERVELSSAAVAIYPGLSPGSYVALTVSDTGCGMTPDVLEHAFDPFFTTKDVGQGTGLGLASVYGVVTQHRGTIRVYSEPGIGTSFKVLLPVVTRSVEHSASPTIGPRARHHELILVAEDEPLVRDLTVRTLERAGYRTLYATDGRDALDIFERRRDEISLVMLDVVMPRLNGHEVYQRMREVSPGIRVIFTSAYDLETAQLGFIGDHGLRFVQKPCGPAALLQTIREVLDHRGAEALGGDRAHAPLLVLENENLVVPPGTCGLESPS